MRWAVCCLEPAGTDNAFLGRLSLQRAPCDTARFNVAFSASYTHGAFACIESRRRCRWIYGKRRRLSNVRHSLCSVGLIRDRSRPSICSYRIVRHRCLLQFRLQCMVVIGKGHANMQVWLNGQDAVTARLLNALPQACASASEAPIFCLP
jgi:hypothetical protein